MNVTNVFSLSGNQPAVVQVSQGVRCSCEACCSVPTSLGTGRLPFGLPDSAAESSLGCGSVQNTHIEQESPHGGSSVNWLILLLSGLQLADPAQDNVSACVK